MKLEFDVGKGKVTEFGIGRDDSTERTFSMVPVNADVKEVLCDMVQATWNKMDQNEDGPAKYEPSEKHRSIEYLYVPLRDNLATSIRELHEAVNLSMDGNALANADLSNIFCYFVRMRDQNGRRLTALRRATQFKGVLKSPSKLIQFVSDTLRIVEDRVFKLDSDFDLLTDSNTVHILRPSGFEFIGKLQQAILDAVPQNIQVLQTDLAFVEFDSIENYAITHPRAARYLASIRGWEGTKHIDKTALEEHCKRTGVEVKGSGGKVTVSTGHEMGFLEVLDRRRYELELVRGQPERFRASSRMPIKD